MTLKELLEEVEDSKLLRDKAVKRSSPSVGATWVVKTDLAFDLARRLKLAMEALKYAETHLDWCSHKGPFAADVMLTNLRAKMVQVEGPEPSRPPTIRDRIRETPGGVDSADVYPVVKNATQECPTCKCLMGRAEKSKGWYCAIDHIFLPDDCV